jgi:hypothetical protein
MLVLVRAYELGATLLEKHFTHDKTLPGNDHYHAMAADDLRRFRDAITLLHRIEGQAQKTVLPVEELSRKNARRSLVASRPLKAGQVLELKDLAVKRPAFGLPPSALEWVLGHKLRRDLGEDARDRLELVHRAHDLADGRRDEIVVAGRQPARGPHEHVLEPDPGVEVVAQTADEAGSTDPSGEGRDVHVPESVSPVRDPARPPRNAGGRGKSHTNNTNRLDAECMTRV